MNKIINNYKGLSNPVKVSLWFTFASFLQSGINFLTAPIFARILSTEEFGVVNVFNSWNTVFTIILSLSLFKSLMNLYLKHDNKELVLSSVVSLSLIVTIFWLLIFIVFYENISNILGLSPLLSASIFVNVIFTVTIKCWSVYKRYIYEYKSIIKYTLLTTILSAIISVIVVVNFSQTAEGRVLPRIIITSIVAVPIIISIFKKGKKFYDKNIWKFALVFSVALLPHYLSEFVLSSSDKLMINYMMDSSSVAIYSIAYTIGSLITLLTVAINASFAPFQYQMIKAKKYEKLSKTADQVLIIVAISILLIMLLSKEIVFVFGGQKYHESASLVIPICLGVYFNYMFQLFARVQEYFERKKTVAIPSVLCAVLNLILNYIFIPKYGYQAAAYTTFVSYLIFCIIHYLFYKAICIEKLNGEEIYNLRMLLIISIIVISGAIIISFLNQNLILKSIIIIISILMMIINRNRIKNQVREMF
jgi:O-antigen/teichoic acid export membrane protein